MGLINYNYVSKSTGITLSQAYAKLHTLTLNKDGTVRAVFAVHQTRENTEKYHPLDKVEITFTWDRKTDIAKMAYELAKKQTVYVQNPDTLETTKERGVLFGWLDDIV